MNIKVKELIVLLLLFWAGTLQAQQYTGPKPNIIFVLVDDMGYGDVGAFFQKLRQEKADRSEPWLFTPQLDKMASEGAMLPQQYCAAPVCAPSRASLLLGVSQGHANVRDNQFDKALEDNYTLGNVLQKAGYSTVAIGKWGLQGKSKSAPDWPAHPLKRGFDYYFGYIAHGDGHEHYPKEGIYRNPKKVWENYVEISQKLDKCYSGDLFTAVAKRYITEHVRGKDSEKPFFMYLAYDTPHAVLELGTQAYPAAGGLKGGVQWLGQSGKMINTASGEPDSYMYPQYANATYDHDKDLATSEVPWPETYKRYASVIHRIDDQVGDILKLLQDLAIEKNTLVIFTSDNGPSKESYLPESYVAYEADFFNSFGPFDGIKRDCLEGGLRTPTIAWWPGTISAHTKINTPSISYDWMPTFTELAGFPAPVRSDGVSLLPSLTGKGKQPSSNIYVEYFHPSKSPGYSDFTGRRRNQKRYQMQMIRLGDTVGVRYDIQSANDDFEIYDIIKDPQQLSNIASQSPALQHYLKSRVLQARMADTTAARPYDQALVPDINVGSIKNGLRLSTYQVGSSWIPLTAGLQAELEITVMDFSIEFKNNLAVFSGLLQVPADGEYRFFLSASGKAFLKVHDAHVIDADYGYHSGEEKQAAIRLKAGYHPISLYYLKQLHSGSPAFSLQWSYNGQQKQQIPLGSFFN